jgi:hypothetical protein
MQARGTARRRRWSGEGRGADGATSAPVEIQRVHGASVFQSPHGGAAAWPIFNLLDTGTRSYEGFRSAAAASTATCQAERFGAFIAPYLRGYVLDVGCGPQPVPSYLRDYPCRPDLRYRSISTADDHPFEFVNAIRRYLARQAVSRWSAQLRSTIFPARLSRCGNLYQCTSLAAISLLGYRRAGIGAVRSLP